MMYFHFPPQTVLQHQTVTRRFHPLAPAGCYPDGDAMHLETLFEHNGAVLIDQDIVMQVVPYSARQDDLFQVAPLADHILD